MKLVRYIVGDDDRGSIIEHKGRYLMEDGAWSGAQSHAIRFNIPEKESSNLYCGKCNFLSPTEQSQEKSVNTIHLCKLFNKRVKHYKEHPLLPRLDECRSIGKPKI